MNIKYLIQYMHPFHHKWITEEKCDSLEEAQETVKEKKKEVTRILKGRRTTLTWRIQPLD
jgi:hypothetical protein